jgi:hypothetical protein
MLPIATLLIIAIVAARFIKNFFNTDTVITQAPAVVSKVSDSNGAITRYNEGTFSLSLPASWKMIGHKSSPLSIYSWQVVVGKISRRLDVYIDSIPLTLGVNEVLPVKSSGNGVKTSGQISDNCSTFTKLPAGTKNTTSIKARWQGVNFFCDLGNYERNVAGTSSTEGANVVTVTGKNSGAHKIFFVYTDNSINPNYTDFYSVLQSFHLK